MMRVEAIKQCDVLVPGPEHPQRRRRALFPGQTYDLPDTAEAVVKTLEREGLVKVLKGQPAPQTGA